MTEQQMKLKSFDMKNIPFILDVVTPLWSPSAGDDDFKRFDVEYIIRNNIFENDYNFELIKDSSDNNTNCSNDTFLSAAFFARKGDINKAAEWFAVESARFSDELKAVSELSRTYIELMDKRTFDLMNRDDIKLSLFVSRRQGYNKEKCR